MSYIHVCMTLSGMWPVMYTWGPTTISGVLISAPGVLMDNDNDNHLFLHLSPESRILSAQKWQKSLMKPGRARRIMKPFLTRQGLDVSSSRENSNIKICIIGSNCLMQTTQKISKHIKTNELFEQLQSRCDNPLIIFTLLSLINAISVQKIKGGGRLISALKVSWKVRMIVEEKQNWTDYCRINQNHWINQVIQEIELILHNFCWIISN